MATHHEQERGVCDRCAVIVGTVAGLVAAGIEEEYLEGWGLVSLLEPAEED